MCFRRRVCGFCLLSFSFGMFLGVILTNSALILAALLLIIGFWLLFM